MLNEINKNEEQYVKARLDELPSWVNRDEAFLSFIAGVSLCSGLLS